MADVNQKIGGAQRGRLMPMSQSGARLPLGARDLGEEPRASGSRPLYTPWPEHVLLLPVTQRMSQYLMPGLPIIWDKDIKWKPR